MSDVSAIGGTTSAALADNQFSVSIPTKAVPITAPEDSPAVIVSIRNDPTQLLANQPPTIHASANQVANVLSWASGANSFVVWDDQIAEVLRQRTGGIAATKQVSDKQVFDKQMSDTATISLTRHALSELSGLGVPHHFTTSSGTSNSNGPYGVISVGAFNFTDGVSSYTVRPDPNGTLVGTKDGQAWLTMQFTSFPEPKGQPAPAAGAGTTSAPVVSASQNPDQPAAIGSLGTASTATTQQVLDAHSDAINKATSPSGGADDLTWLHHQEGWGPSAYNPDTPVQQAVNPGPVDDSSIKTTSAVKSFSFSHQGSVYSISHASDGLLVGMKDGQRWDGWQAKGFAPGKNQDGGVASALDTLTSIIASLASAGKARDVINVTV